MQGRFLKGRSSNPEGRFRRGRGRAIPIKCDPTPEPRPPGIAGAEGGRIADTKKPGETKHPRPLKSWIRERLRSVPLELADFVLDAELLTLQIVDCVLIGKRTLVFFIESAFECGVLFLQRLDAILQRHARSSF